jgi:para-aminobenzoate synthetase / 4-amino-4-deoxychorismate lyase
LSSSSGTAPARRPTVAGAPVAAPADVRPDPALGVFETLLVTDGRPLELDAHLARLDASLHALFCAPCPPAARRLVLDRARGAGLARLRLTVAPEGDRGLAADVVVAPVDAALVMPGWDRGVELAPRVVAGGIGAHKWADRRLLADADAALAPRLPLLIDRDGAALEASRGNLFVVRDGTLVTPPADGRILPGVTRRRVLLLAAGLDVPLREEAVPFDRLGDADGMFVTGAVRGIEPVRGCDGSVVGPEQEITPLLCDELRRSWAHDAAAADSPPRGDAADARTD